MLLFTALGATALPSHAEDPAASSAEGTKKAESLFAEGMRFVAQQKWAEAEAKFLPAWSLSPSYDIAANLGQTQYRLGKYREAAEHLAFALRHWPVVGKREPRDLAQKRLEELRPKVGTLRIAVNVAGAMVVVDGREIGRSPLEEEVFVDAGARTVEARLEGYEVAKQQVEAATGVEQKVGMTLVLAKQAGAPAPGGAPASTGRGGGGAPPSPPLVVEEGGANRGVLVAGGVAAGVGLSLGVVFAVLANGKASDAEQQVKALGSKAGPDACISGAFARECDAIHLGPRQDQVRFANLSVWSFSTAGALGVGTLIYALAAPKAVRNSQVQVNPVAVSQGGGVMLRGTW